MYKYNTTWLKNKRNIFHGDNCTLNVFSLSLFVALVFVLLVCSHEGGEDAVLLLQQGLGPVVLQDDAPLHHNHQVGIQDGVDAMLREKSRKTSEKSWCTLTINWLL